LNAFVITYVPKFYQNINSAVELLHKLRARRWFRSWIDYTIFSCRMLARS